MRIKILPLILLALAFFTAAHAQTLDKAKLDRFFDRLAEKNKAMGSMTLVKDGKVLYSRAIGYSQINDSQKKPSTAATRYRIGSITKMFTAVMIFQLVEKGKLKLSDTLDKFFPQVPNAGKITVAQMLAHRSGIYDFTNDSDFRSWKMNAKTEDEMLAIIAKGKPVFEPGEKTEYSNSGFLLLGYIIEKVGGKPYGEALKERITSKIGLKDTYLGSGKTDVGKNESFSFNYVGDWKQETETDLSIPGGAGAIVSTPGDLTGFIQALFDGKLVSQANLAAMKPIKDKYGSGIILYPLEGKTFYGHGGGIDGFSSLLIYQPEEKLALACSTNGKGYPLTRIVDGVLDIYQNKPFQIPDFETVAVSPEVLEKYVGVYSSPATPLKLTITRDGSTLQAQATGQPSFPLEATAQDKFKVESRGIVLEFDAAKNQVTFKRGKQELVFTKEQ
ncbi:MAG TPA: serine hydrolase domain-containing protein [Pyrinomonadaceae bacterium]|jgi:CubicO group peptidase (beta-lactamase class C family)